MSTNFCIRNRWIFVLIAASRVRSSTELEDCPLMAKAGEYCIKNDNGIVPTILDNDIWITFNRSVAKSSLTLSDFKSGILPLPIQKLHIGDPSGPVLAVYSQSKNWRVGVANTKMKSTNNSNKVSDAFVLIRSTLCNDCCFIMAANFTQFTLSDIINETWNGMLYWSDTDLFVSSENNKPATISDMLWQMGSDTDAYCHDGSPLGIRGTIPRKTTTSEKCT